jgi:hypothetical protein
MKEERNLYKAAGNREVTVFPGSNLYERREKNSKGKPGQDKGRQPLWIVAGEIVHTTQLFARTVAKMIRTGSPNSARIFARTNTASRIGTSKSAASSSRSARCMGWR